MLALFLTFPSYHPFYMVCSFYRLSLPCSTTIVFSAYVSTEDNNDTVNIMLLHVNVL